MSKGQLTLALLSYVASASLPAHPPAHQIVTCTGQTATTQASAIDPEKYAPNSTFAANSLSSDWLNRPGVVIRNNSFTAARANYLVPDNPAAFVLQSRRCSRDMEVDTWTRSGYVILRLSPAGTGIYFAMHGETANGQLEIGIITGAGENSVLPGKRYALYVNRDLAHTVGGYRSSHTDGDYFTFGVEGFHIYARLNGKEFVRFQEYRAMQAGIAALQATETYGFRKTALRHKTPAPLGSDVQEHILDLRDFGISDLRATGSMDAHSTQLVLGSAGTARFQPGDSVLVEVGGEAGQGMRGTRGVGGTWPQVSYVDATAMYADRSKAGSTFAWLETDGSVYQFLNERWQARDPSLYYTSVVYPLALRAKVVDVSGDGLTLTLDTPASVQSVNAAVYFDNSDILQSLLSDALQNGQSNDLAAITPTGVTLLFPAGNFALSAPIIVSNHPHWKILGQGPEYSKIFSPKGAVSAGIVVAESPYAEIRNLHVQGNAQDNGYGLSVSQTAAPQGASYPNGILFQQSDNSVASHLRVTDVFQGGMHAALSNNVWADHIAVFMSQGYRQYLSWLVAWSDSTGGGCTDCSVTSAALISGFESFSSLNTQFIHCSGVNAIVSMNSAGGFLVDGMTLTIEPDSQHDENSFSKYQPVVNINSNIGRGTYLPLGGTLKDVTITELGYINGDHDVLRGIVINDTTPNITVLGGKFTAPDYEVPSVLSGPVGLDSTGVNTTVDGLSTAGMTNPTGIGNINMVSGVLKNCIADRIVAGNGVVVQNCKSNTDPVTDRPRPKL